MSKDMRIIDLPEQYQKYKKREEKKNCRKKRKNLPENLFYFMDDMTELLLKIHTEQDIIQKNQKEIMKKIEGLETRIENLETEIKNNPKSPEPATPQASIPEVPKIAKPSSEDNIREEEKIRQKTNELVRAFGTGKLVISKEDARRIVESGKCLSDLKSELDRISKMPNTSKKEKKLRSEARRKFISENITEKS